MASTLAAQAVLDAIAAELAGRRGIDAKRFLALHPAGALGEIPRRGAGRAPA
ncbi:MAG: hypothetical protein HY608_00200 [Planctomycetes bacterium]|nr:hypothetical protein [Planctomycetota bacterium]